MTTDPGWRPALRVAARGFIPWKRLRPRRALEGLAPLTGARAIYLSAIITWTLFFMILAIIDEPTAPRTSWFPLLVGAVGIGSLALILMFRRRPLDATSPASLVSSFRQISMIGFAMSDTPVLVGFVGFFVTGELWVYTIGVPVGLVGLWLAGPTRANLSRYQQQLRFRGSPLPLDEILSKPEPTG